MNDLKVCEKCGWYDGLTHASECTPQNGKVASELQGKLNQVPSTKLGYGIHNVVFESDDNFHVRFRVSDNIERLSSHPFGLRDVWLLDSLDQEAAADLVRTLDEWRQRQVARKGFR